MFKKKYRLTSRHHHILQESGIKQHYTNATLQYLDTKTDTPTLCAVVIPKKVYKKSVDRHATKRKIVDILYNLYPQFKKGYWFSIILRKPINSFTPRELTQVITEITEPLR